MVVETSWKDLQEWYTHENEGYDLLFPRGTTTCRVCAPKGTNTCFLEGDIQEIQLFVKVQFYPQMK